MHSACVLTLLSALTKRCPSNPLYALKSCTCGYDSLRRLCEFMFVRQSIDAIMQRAQALKNYGDGRGAEESFARALKVVWLQLLRLS